MLPMEQDDETLAFLVDQRRSSGHRAPSVSVSTPNLDFASMLSDTSAVVTSSSSKTEMERPSPTSTSYYLYLYTRQESKEDPICGGVINTMRYARCFCARSARTYVFASHTKVKDPALSVNRVYLITLNPRSSSPLPKAINPHEVFFQSDGSDPELKKIDFLIRLRSNKTV